MAYNYSWNDSPAPVTPSNISSLSPSVQRNPPMPVARPATPTTTDPNSLDFSVFDGMDPRQDPAGPSSPMPSTRVQGNPFFNFLSALFGHSGGSPQQGMTGLLNTPRGVDSLGNPFNRFG